MRGKGTGELEQRVQENWKRGERSKGHRKRQKDTRKKDILGIVQGLENKENNSKVH